MRLVRNAQKWVVSRGKMKESKNIVCPQCGSVLTRGERVRGVCSNCKEPLKTQARIPPAPNTKQTEKTAPIPLSERRSFKTYRVKVVLLYTLPAIIIAAYSIAAIIELCDSAPHSVFGGDWITEMILWGAATAAIMLFFGAMNRAIDTGAYKKIILIGMIIIGCLAGAVFFKLIADIAAPRPLIFE